MSRRRRQHRTSVWDRFKTVSRGAVMYLMSHDFRDDIAEVLFWPFSMMSAKHNRSRRLSQLRVIVMLFAVEFARHWPTTWGHYDVLALTAILLTLPADNLLTRIPIPEIMDAIHSIAVSVATSKLSKASSALGSITDGSGGGDIPNPDPADITTPPSMK